MLEIPINIKQIIAVIWTIIAVAISIMIVFAPLNTFAHFSSSLPWQAEVLLFFVSLLVLTLPVYLMLGLWHFLSEKSETD